MAKRSFLVWSWMSCMAPRNRSGSAHQHGGTDGSLLAAAPAATSFGQCLHDFDGFVVGGLAELIDCGGRHLHEQESSCDAFRVFLMPTLQPESDLLKVEQTLNFPAFQVATHDGKYVVCAVGQEYPAERLFTYGCRSSDTTTRTRRGTPGCGFWFPASEPHAATDLSG